MGRLSTPIPRGLELLATAVAANSSVVDFIDVMDFSRYSKFLLVAYDVVPSTDSVGLNLQVSADNGATFEVLGYRRRVNANPLDLAQVGESFSAGTEFRLTNNTSQRLGNAANESIRAGRWWLSRDGNGLAYEGTCEGLNAGTNHCRWYGDGSHDAAVNAIRLLMSLGNIQSGTFMLYGLRT